MRIKIISFILFVFFCFFSTLSFAENSGFNNEENNVLKKQEINKNKVLDDISARIATRQALLKEKFDEKKDNVSSRQAEIRENLTLRKKFIIRDFFSRMTVKMENALKRQEKISEKISSRLSKLKANGKDTGPLEVRLSQAKSIHQDIKELIEKAKLKLEDVLSSSNPQGSFKEVRELLLDIVVKIKEVHKLYVEIITEMKGMSETIKGEISPTAKVSTGSSGTSININTQTNNSSVKVSIQSNTNVKTIITITP